MPERPGERGHRYWEITLPSSGQTATVPHGGGRASGGRRRTIVETKGRSPFYPGQPIPAERFTSILQRLASLDTDEFTRDELAAILDDDEKGRLDNVLQRMKTLQVLWAGAFLGECAFSIRLYQVDLAMKIQRPSFPGDGARNG